MKKLVFKTAIVAAILSVGLLSSCEKDEEEEVTPTSPITGPAAPTEVEKLSNKEFLLTAFVSRSGSFTFRTIADLDPCEKDNILFFAKDFTGYLDEGPTKCISFDDQRKTSTYRLVDVANGADSLLVDYGNGDRNNYTIVINDGTQLKLTQVAGRNGSTVLYEDFTFRKK